MRIVYTLFILVSTFGIFNNSLNAQLEVEANSSAAELVANLLGDGVELLDVSLNCPDGAVGTFNGEFTNLNVNDGVLLTSGNIANAIGPNDNSGAATDNGSGGDADLDGLIPGFATQDACVLEISFIPYGDTLSFNYVFGSEEYAGFVCSDFNDVFGFFIEGGEYTEPTNIALIPNSDLAVSINNVNIGVADGSVEPCNLDNTEYYVDNGTGNVTLPNSTIQYDGFTVVIPAIAAVTPCQEYTLKMAVADAGDGSLDSGVFIQSGSFSVNTFFVEAATTVTTIDGFDYTIEECVDGIVAFSRNYVTDSPVTIDFELGGTAINGEDYEFIDNSITIPAGEATVDLIIKTIDDAIDETPEILTISISNALGCDTILMQEVELQIVDANPMVVSDNVDILFGGSTQLNVEGGGFSYFWSPAESLDNFNSATPIASPTETTTYTVNSVLGDCFYTQDVTVFVTPFDCSPDAGTFTNTNPIYVCDGGSFSISESDYATAAVDTFDSAIILHTLGDESIGEILAINYDASPTFDLSSIDGINYNTPYYVSRIVDLQDDSGLVNPLGACVDVAVGAEVVYLQPISINIESDCDNTTGLMTIELTVSGGLPAYNGSLFTLTGDANLTVGNNEGLLLNYSNNSVVNVFASDAVGCIFDFTDGPIECIKGNAVELISFRGVGNNNGNLLTWQTATETNSDYFTIEKSLNGVEFHAIADVKTNGNESTGANYEYLDADFNTSVFYRLKETDLDGKAALYNVIELTRNDNATVSVYPNPVEDELFINTNFNLNGQVTVAFFDLSGKKVSEQVVNGTNGEKQIKLTTSFLPRGMFLVEIQTVSKRFTTKIVK